MSQGYHISPTTLPVHRPALDAWAAAADDLLNDLEDAAEVDILHKLWATIWKSRDLQMQVRRGWVFDTEFVELLDVVPSTGVHESSIRIESRLLPDLIAQLVSLHGFLAAGPADVGENQGRLW